MPAQYVKACIKRNKHDAAPEAICEAVQRPTMRFCAGQDGGAAGDGTAASWPRAAGAPAPMLVNALRAHLAEFGMVAAQGWHPAAHS